MWVGVHREEGLDEPDDVGPKPNEIAKHVEDAEDLCMRRRVSGGGALGAMDQANKN